MISCSLRHCQAFANCPLIISLEISSYFIFKIYQIVYQIKRYFKNGLQNHPILVHIELIISQRDLGVVVAQFLETFFLKLVIVRGVKEPVTPGLCDRVVKIQGAPGDVELFHIIIRIIARTIIVRVADPIEQIVHIERERTVRANNLLHRILYWQIHHGSNVIRHAAAIVDYSILNCVVCIRLAAALAIITIIIVIIGVLVGVTIVIYNIVLSRIAAIVNVFALEAKLLSFK